MIRVVLAFALFWGSLLGLATSVMVGLYGQVIYWLIATIVFLVALLAAAWSESR